MIVNLFGIFPSYRKDIKKALEQGIMDFPIIQNRIKRVKLTFILEKRFATNTIYWKKCLQHKIYLNIQAFSFPNITKKFKQTRQEHLSNLYNCKDVIFHEIGHIVNTFIDCKSRNLDIDNKIKNKTTKKTSTGVFFVSR